MKFFLEFVACCGLPITDRSTVPKEPAPRADDAKSLVVSSSRKRHRRKRGRLSHSGSASVDAAAAEWKPSLSSISEDNVVVVKGEENRMAEAERVVKRKSESRNVPVHVRSFNDDYGRGSDSVPAVIPAFSPTPFMF